MSDSDPESPSSPNRLPRSLENFLILLMAFKFFAKRRVLHAGLTYKLGWLGDQVRSMGSMVIQLVVLAVDLVFLRRVQIVAAVSVGALWTRNRPCRWGIRSDAPRVSRVAVEGDQSPSCPFGPIHPLAYFEKGESRRA